MPSEHITILHHAVNLGKGQALKTAFNYVLTQFQVSPGGVVTCDSDGQHLVEDILKVTKQLLHHPNTLWLGSRQFDLDVPLRSRFGNTLTRKIFEWLIGQKLMDTQTGLRGIPIHFLPELLQTTSTGYDFELDMLIKAAKRKVQIKEIPITTVYENNNQSSHFNPIIDSFKIYFVFLRFLTFAIVSGLFDFVAFSVMFWLTDAILFSEGIARFFSGTLNFFFNKELVFQSKEKLYPEALKYTLLCLVNLVFSYALINSMVFLGANVYASKIIALTTLFVANFAIQKVVVFKETEQNYI